MAGSFPEIYTKTSHHTDHQSNNQIRTAQSFTSPFSTEGRKGVDRLRTQKYEETLFPEDLQVQKGIKDFGVKLNPNFDLT